MILSLLLASGALIQGEVQPEVVEARVLAKQKELRACYGDRQGLASLLVRFEIGQDGAVTSALVVETNIQALADEPLHNCVLEVFKALRFAPTEHGTVIVSYPVQFGASAKKVKSDRLSQQSIKQVLVEAKPRYEACYGSAVIEKPSLKGAPLTFAFTIGSDGVPMDVEIHSGHGVRAIDKCMQAAVASLRFAKPREGEKARIQYPYVIW